MDLFDFPTAEATEERIAIMADSGIVDDAKARADVEAFRHKSEVDMVMRRMYPDGKQAKAYFDDVEKKRGKPAADRLRDDVRVIWKAKTA